MFASPLVFKMGYVKTQKKSCIARIVNSWHWIDRCAGKDIHYFCWHAFEKCHKLVCCKKGLGHYETPYKAFCAPKRDSVRVRTLAGSRYKCTSRQCCFTYISFLRFDLLIWTFSSKACDKYMFIDEANNYSVKSSLVSNS